MEPEKTKTTGKDFFLYLASLIALYISFGSLITLIFNNLNYLFPDVLTDSYYYYDPYSASVRFAISMLLVVFPTFLGLVYYINRSLLSESGKTEIWVRRWSIYLTVFLAGAIIVGDLVALINTFLNGEVTERFMYKVLALLLVSGLVLAYYVSDIRGRILTTPILPRIYGALATILVIGSIVAGFLIVGSPAKARMVQFDVQKISDLQSMQWQIVNYWQRKQALPTTISDLNDPIGGYQVPKDRQTGENYLYEKTGNLSYKVCATFNLDRDDRAYPSVGGQGGSVPIYDSYIKNSYTDAPEYWKYKKGKTCFERTIDPTLYPPIKN